MYLEQYELAESLRRTTVPRLPPTQVPRYLAITVRGKTVGPFVGNKQKVRRILKNRGHNKVKLIRL